MATAVYSPQAFVDDLTRVICASQHTHTVRACLLTTRDRDYTFSLLKETVTTCQRPLYHFTLAERRRYNPAHLQWEVVGSEAPDATGLLHHAYQLRGGGVVAFEDCAALVRDEGGDQRLRMMLADPLAEVDDQGAQDVRTRT